MAQYSIIAHDAMLGSSVDHDFVVATRQGALFQAEVLFKCGAYLWIDVLLKDARGRMRYVHHLEREPTQVEREAISRHNEERLRASLRFGSGEG